jgi:hypothetical protein
MGVKEVGKSNLNVAGPRNIYSMFINLRYIEQPQLSIQIDIYSLVTPHSGLSQSQYS